MKTCSYCGRENADAALRCSECGTEFGTPAKADPQINDPGESLVIVASFGDIVEASLVKARLEEAGIEACIPEELDPSPFGNFPPLAHVTVRVSQKNLESARKVLATTPEGPE